MDEALHFLARISLEVDWTLCINLTTSKCSPDSRASVDDCASFQMHAAPESPCAVGLDDQIWQNQSPGTLVRPWKRTGISDWRNKLSYVIHFFTLHEICNISLHMGINLQRQLSWASSLVWQYHLSHSRGMSWCHRCWTCKDLTAEDITVIKQPRDWPSNSVQLSVHLFKQ